MKLCRLIDWLKPNVEISKESYDSLLDTLHDAEATIYDLSCEIDRKEAVIQQLLERTKLAETMLIKYRRQRNQLKKERGNS